jgi:hypothetical protein
MEKGRQSGSLHSNSLIVAPGHDFGSRPGRPVEGMRVGVPLRHKGHQAFSQLIQVREIADAQPLALSMKATPFLAWETNSPTISLIGEKS